MVLIPANIVAGFRIAMYMSVKRVMMKTKGMITSEKMAKVVASTLQMSSKHSFSDNLVKGMTLMLTQIMFGGFEYIILKLRLVSLVML